MSVGAIDVSDEDRRRHREAEKSLKEVRIRHSCLCLLRIYAYLPEHVLTAMYYQAKQKLASQVKVRRDRLLLLTSPPNRIARCCY